MKFYTLLLTTTLLTMNIIGADTLRPLTNELRTQLFKWSSEANLAGDILLDKNSDIQAKEKAKSTYLVCINNVGYYAQRYEGADQNLELYKGIASAAWEQKSPYRFNLIYVFLQFDTQFVLDQVKSYLLAFAGDDVEGSQICLSLFQMLMHRKNEDAKQFGLASFKNVMITLRQINKNPNDAKWINEITTLCGLVKVLEDHKLGAEMSDDIPAQYRAARDLYFPRTSEEEKIRELNKELINTYDPAMKAEFEKNKVAPYHQHLMAERAICWYTGALSIGTCHPLRQPLANYVNLLSRIFFAEKGHKIWDLHPDVHA